MKSIIRQSLASFLPGFSRAGHVSLRRAHEASRQKPCSPVRKAMFLFAGLLVAAAFNAEYISAQVEGNQYRTTYSPLQVATITNVEEGTTGTASGYSVDNVYDGNTDTYWVSASEAHTHTLEITFDREYPITSLTLVTPASDDIPTQGGTQCRPQTINIQTYNNSRKRWSTVRTLDFNRSNESNTMNFDELEVSQIRLSMDLTDGANRSMVISEIEFLYNASYIDLSTAKIQHRPAKWHAMRAGRTIDDTFSEGVLYYDAPSGIVQATHMYVDTIYMHKGESITLSLPDKYNNDDTNSGSAVTQISARSYQRWYNFRTDGLFRTGNTREDQVQDLLTPNSNGNVRPYRLANGYVGRPLTVAGDRITTNFYRVSFYYPTDDQFEQWKDDLGQGQEDNNYYLVAADVSTYNDFCDPNTYDPSRTYLFTDEYYEPTLAHRVLFYIVGVDDRKDDAWKHNGYSRLSLREYQDGASDDNGKAYLADYEITMPVTRVSNNTSDLVSLPMDARAYAIPDATRDDDGLDIRLIDNTAGISLLTSNGVTTNRGGTRSTTATISGENRRIFFGYPGSADGYGTYHVNEVESGDPVATILVTKTVGGTTYNIARYRLTFKSEVSLLTSSQLKDIEDETVQSNEPWASYSFRVPTTMDNNEALTLLTELNFDYDQEITESFTTNRQTSFYPFPLAWSSSSYGFYDGSNSNASDETTPRWGFYALRAKGQYYNYNFINSSWNKTVTENPYYEDIYHMFVDASDRPGVVAMLPFEEELCSGSELYVTAWVRSASGNEQDAGMLFTIMGISDDGTMTPIYRYSCGQIPNTVTLNSNIPGCGPKHNEWWQLYFSFINKGDKDYVSYALQIENYCAAASGGDFDIDNIRVYIAQPSAEVTQLANTCTGEATPMRITLDWDRFAARMGVGEGEGDALDYIDYCFLNVVAYQNALEAAGGDDSKVDFADYLMPIYGQEPSDGEDPITIGTLSFHRDFEGNEVYNDSWAYTGNTDLENPGTLYRQGNEANDNRALVTNFYATLSPNYPYELLFIPRAGTGKAEAEDFQREYNDPCGVVRTEFRVTSDAQLKMDGEVVRPGETYCAGNVSNFTAQVRVPYTTTSGETAYLTVDQNVYFDWFFGDEVEYTSVQDGYEVSLQDALLAFREEYPDATVEDFNEGATSAVEGSVFTQDCWDVVNYYLNEADPVAGGLNRRLVLHAENLNITLLPGGLSLVVQPIQTEIPEGFELPEDADVDESLAEVWANICWSYIPLYLEASGDAPELHAGFGSVKYPDVTEGRETSTYNPNLRIGLKQIEAIAQAGEESNSTDMLRIDLRGAKFATDDADHMGIMEVQDDTYDHIYLTGTNDPAYTDLINNEAYDAYSLPIGTIDYLYAAATGETNADYMRVYFNLEKQTVYNNVLFTFAPKEGYYYIFSVPFMEYTGRESIEPSTSCFGHFPVRMDVVPEYLVWQGEATDNWNNDVNWHRADRDEWNGPNSYVTNETNYENAAELTSKSAYVPMLFSKVIIPAGKSVELYPAGFINNRTTWDTERPAYIGQPTENLQYDLMVYEQPDNTGSGNQGRNTRFTTEQYRVSLCDQIHFEPGAQMRHSQYLLYNKAEVDVTLPAREWTNVGLPLRDVVAGDWYTQSTGTDAGLEYFRELKNPNDGPRVFQRSWGDGARIVESTSATTDVTLGVAEWSAAYNDASVAYTAGAGFSVRSDYGSESKTEVLFRFPKSEESYEVSTGTFTRENAGKLASSQFLSRDDINGYTGGTELNNQEFTVTLSPSLDGNYFIVGNPFVCHLNVIKFLEENKNFLKPQYWTADGSDPMTGVQDEATGEWITTAGVDSAFIAPHGAFYVERAEGAGSGDITVTFTAAMQSLNLPAEGGTFTANAGLVLTAANAAGRSTALVSFSNRADDGYAEGEDVQLVDFGAGAYVPLVYSVAGQKAAAINRLAGAQMIPLGVYATDEEETVTLSFDGVSNLAEASLYDAETRTETPLTEGYTMTVKGSSHGRYFLRATGDFTGLEELPDERETEVSVYSPLPGELIVAAVGQTLERVRVYDAAGALCYDSGALNEEVCRTSGLAGGTYVVTVQADGATHSYKVALK